MTRYSEADAAAMKGYPTDDLIYRKVHGFCKGAEGLPLSIQVKYVLKHVQFFVDV